jgi:hypothetical protein
MRIVRLSRGQWDSGGLGYDSCGYTIFLVGIRECLKSSEAPQEVNVALFIRVNNFM